LETLFIQFTESSMFRVELLTSILVFPGSSDLLLLQPTAAAVGTIRVTVR
jgi:hypothetical protein